MRKVIASIILILIGLIIFSTISMAVEFVFDSEATAYDKDSLNFPQDITKLVFGKYYKVYNKRSEYNWISPKPTIPSIYSHYMENSDLYCVQKGQSILNPYSATGQWKDETLKAKKSKGYYLYGKVVINGYNAKVTNRNSKVKDTGAKVDNAIMAYILSKSVDSAYDKVEQKETNNNGEYLNIRQIAIWKYFATWKNNVWKEALESDFAANSGDTEIKTTNTVQTEVDELINTSKVDAKNMKPIITVDKKGSVQYVNKSGKIYARIGPIKIKYTGNLSKIEVTFSDETKTTYSTANISSEKEFYIEIDMSNGIKEIDNINFTASKKTKGNLKITIYLLAPENNSWQNLIAYDKEQTEVEYTTSEKIEYKNKALVNITIEKVDKDNNSIKLSGVGFKLKNNDLNQYIKNENGKIIYVTDELEATEFVTNSEGKITINNLLAGNYTIYETKNPNNGYETETGNTYSIKLTSTMTKVLTNEKKVGNLKIVKVDADDTNYKLENVKFILQKDGKYIIYDRTSKKITGYTTNKEEATEFITDENGEIYIENLLIGTYKLIETENPHYGYELITEEVTVEKSKTVTQTVKNKQKYIKLSGYVWEDFIQDDKVSTKNNLFHDGTSDVNDKLLNGITVRLKDTSGKIIQETKTQKLDIYTTNGNDGNGEYRFENVEKDKLGDYYIEFEYDGLVYTNVERNVNKDNGSKAIENSDDRALLNMNFRIVRGGPNSDDNKTGYGYTINPFKQKVHDLTYTLNNHTATLVNDGKTFLISANTNEEDENGQKYDLSTKCEAGQEEIKYINLGIYKREQPQLVVRKEIENVKLGINDFEHTYVYENRFDNQEIKAEYEQSGYGVKFGEKYLNTKYSLPVYTSDYTTELDPPTKELEVYVTYKIEIINQANTLYSLVSSIVDHYDDQCEIVTMGDGIDDKGNVIQSDPANPKIEYKETFEPTKYEGTNLAGTESDEPIFNGTGFDGYKTSRIWINDTIDPLTSKEIYIQFKLSREKVAEIIMNNENPDTNEELVDNVVEIYEYTTYGGEKKELYAGIDKSSNPANAEPGNTDTFELDTDRAPGLLLEDGGDRQVTGIVFEDKDEDKDEDKLKTGYTRKGDGRWDEENEPVIEEKVTVTLKDKNGTEKGSTTTNENGEYAISGFIPGEYNIVFSWGNGDKYIVEDYKGTVYDKTRYDTNSSNLYWYKEDSEKQTRYSDALDDYTIRERIPTDWIEPSGTIMNSKTPNFKVDVEIESDPNTGKKISSQISNIDFGIIEMARQAIEIHKNVSELKITLANGQTIVDAKMEDGKLLEPVPWVKFEGKKLWVEMESELIQGSQLNLKYDMSIDNKSEIDYITDDYYLYGIEPEAQEEKDEKVAKIELDVVYDYIDSEFMLNNEENGDWTEISENEYNTVENTTNTILTIQELWNREYIITDGKPEKNDSVDYGQLGDWINEAKTSRKEYFKDKAILVTTSFQGELKPGESTIDSIGVVNLTASKLLGGNDEIDLNNEVEITKIVKDSTRKITPAESVVKAKAESTTVTSPTGENRSYIIPVIISISVLIVLGAGIILIKKKIIEK